MKLLKKDLTATLKVLKELNTIESKTVIEQLQKEEILIDIISDLKHIKIKTGVNQTKRAIVSSIIELQGEKVAVHKRNQCFCLTHVRTGLSLRKGVKDQTLTSLIEDTEDMLKNKPETLAQTAEKFETLNEC